MSVLIWLIPVAIAMGGLGLLAFMWSLKSGQFDDLDGAAHRILIDDDKPLLSKEERDQAETAEGSGDGAKSR
ncbi:cbb3-type cytochrome oxidase assembly protein CcoS [Maricaulis sp.]|jgi:cbb3-type cytochrome oxidase maturation protein|uniref:cbb3-type cytochrome oxidase assembly protein CcoS n=1 Tax=Maricaulis sp. TaxID=1486257 RepID=UPI0026325571|nr:cbb3-type cytochrome oxidase assembly protein CcoS [Maricaulis sp.]